MGARPSASYMVIDRKHLPALSAMTLLCMTVRQGGLVVVDARYGVLEAILAEEAVEAAAAAAKRADSPAGSGPGEAGAGEAAAGGPDAGGLDAGGPEASPRGSGGGNVGSGEEGRDRWRGRGGEKEEEEDDDEEDAAAVAAAAADAAAAQPPSPPPWVDVTLATRFLVSRGRIVLHQVRCEPVILCALRLGPPLSAYLVSEEAGGMSMCDDAVPRICRCSS